MAELPTGTVTFLFTDIEGSTRLWEQRPEAMQAALARHDALLHQNIAARSGHVFKTVGDQFCAAFASAADALAAALAAQCDLQTEDWGEVGPLRVRMALHTGAAEPREGDYFGPPLNRVARLLAVAHGDQILFSAATEERVRAFLPAEASLRDLGSHLLKDLQQPEHLYQLLHPSLPAAFPPLRSLEAFAHNLPAQLTRFIGREKEMAEIKRLLLGLAIGCQPSAVDQGQPALTDSRWPTADSPRLLTLTGMGGTGKTRLALQVAADRLEEYLDGVWLVELAPLADAALVPQAVASVLGVREEPNRPLLATLSDYLRPRSLLIVLDNCEHLLQACAPLAEGLLRACPKLRILATSREGLGIAGEQTYRVPSLTMPDARKLPPVERLTEYEAIQLFIDRAVLSQSNFAITRQNAPAVARVCHRLDGIPLALELAAARVKALPVEQIAERLDDRFRLLTGGSRTALPRQQTLRALIDWSYDLLTEPERRLLRRLSIFAGGWTLEAAETVCGDEAVGCRPSALGKDRPLLTDGRQPTADGPLDVLDALIALVDKSLVLYEERSGHARYRFLETVRQYSRDRLLEAGEAPAVGLRHRDWFLELAEQAEPALHGPEQMAWLEQLEVEHDNLRAALDGCLKAVDSGQWLVDSPTEAGSKTDLSLSEPTTIHYPLTTAVEAALRMVGALPWFWFKRGHLVEGRRRVEGALTAGREAAPARRAKALNAGSLIAYCLGDYGAVRSFGEEALALWQQLGDKRGIAVSLVDLGLGTVSQSDFERARTFLEDGLLLSRQNGDPWRIAYCLVILGEVFRLQGDYRQANACYEESLALLRQVGDKWGTAIALQNAGQVAQYHGDWERAKALHREGVRLCQEINERAILAGGMEKLAGVAGGQGQPHPPSAGTRAARLLGAAEALREAVNAPVEAMDRPDYDRSVAAARAALDDEAFRAAWAEGRALSVAEAVSYALDEGNLV